MEALIEAFDINLVGLAFQVLNFLLLLYILNRLLFKPLLARMDERSDFPHTCRGLVELAASAESAGAQLDAAAARTARK